MFVPGDCERFETDLQDLMDRRIDPRTGCGDHPHLSDCEACRQRIDEFSALYSALEAFSCKSGNGLILSANSSPNARRYGARTVGPGRGEIETFERIRRAIAMTIAFFLVTIVTSILWQSDGFPVFKSAVPGVMASVDPPTDFPSVRNHDYQMQIVQNEASLGDRSLHDQANFPGRTNDIANPGTTLTTYLRIADNVPGMPPVRNSLVQTLDWIKSVIPKPEIPSLPFFSEDWFDLGFREGKVPQEPVQIA